MSNEILKFADTSTNLPTQVEYAADPERNTGNVPGVAKSKLVNKVLRQCAFISNGFAEYLISKVGGDVLDNNDSTALLAKITSAFTFTLTNDNFIINGNFDFWQRNTTFTVSTTNTYTADRWVGVLTGSTAVVTRQATALTESFMAKYFLRAAVTSSVGTSNFYYQQQRIEDVRRLANRSIKVSFWAKADSARNMSYEVVQNFGTGGSPSAEVNSLGVNKIALTTSWQKFTATVVIPSISGKVIGTDGNSYTGLNFWFDAGSSYNARTNSLGQQSGTFDVAQVKVEEGTNATDFVLAGKSIEGELAACQRYYEKSFDLDVAPGSVIVVANLAFGNHSGGTSTYVSVSFSTKKRIAPTCVSYSITGTANAFRNITVGLEAMGVSVLGVNQNGVMFFRSGDDNSMYMCHFTANAEI